MTKQNDSLPIIDQAEKILKMLRGLAIDYLTLLRITYLRWDTGPWQLLYQSRIHLPRLTPLVAVTLAAFLYGTIAVSPSTTVYAYFGSLEKLITPDLKFLNALIAALPTVLVALPFAYIGALMVPKKQRPAVRNVFLYLLAAQLIIIFVWSLLLFSAIALVYHHRLPEWVLGWIPWFAYVISIPVLMPAWFWFSATRLWVAPTDFRFPVTCLVLCALSWLALCVAAETPGVIRLLRTPPPSVATTQSATSTAPTSAPFSQPTVPPNAGRVPTTFPAFLATRPAIPQP